MKMLLNGKAWCFGGLLDVDWELCPRSAKDELRQLGREITDEDYGPYCMSVVDPTFAKRVEVGDFLVGEDAFGYGHDHDHPCRSIKGCGVAAVLCESSTPYFLRNSFNLGLLVLEIPGIFAATETGNEIEVNLEEGVCVNRSTGWSATFPRVPDFLIEIIDAGGVNKLAEAGR
jgi:3-isopropylmalate/(R)-2-methylmalate dehydratase small subunit